MNSTGMPMSQPVKSMAGSQDLSGDEFFFGNLPEYLDGELSTEALARFEAMLKEPQFKDVPEAFQNIRGRLQIGFQEYGLNSDDLQTIRNLVRDPVVIATQEAVEIEQLGRGVAINSLFRQLMVLIFVSAGVGAIVWKFFVPHENTFKALEYLGYEAQILNAEKAEKILDFPSDDINEIKQYFGANQGLQFNPGVLKPLPSPWIPDGAKVIDYEIAKVTVVEYSNSQNQEKLFHFSYIGNLSDLPPAEPGNMRGLIYQTYTSDDMNFIAWQSGNNVVSLLVGRRSAKELAELAVRGSVKY